MESTVAVDTSVPQARIAHAFSVQLICRALGMLASVFSVAMTARYLGPDGYGKLTIAATFIAMWTSLADLGTGTVIVRRVTSGRGELERLVRVNSGLALMYCVPLALLAAGAGLIIYHDHDVRVMLVLLSGQLLMLTMTTRFEPVFLTTVRFSAVALSDVASRVGTLAMVAALVAMRADVIWFAVAQLIPPVLQLLIQGGAAARHLSVRPVFSWSESLGLLRESFPLAAVMVVAVLYWRVDGVILSLVSSHAEVGFYGLSYTIAFNVEMLSIFFLKSTLSTATELFARDRVAFTDFLRRSVELMYFLAIPIAVVGTLLAGPLIRLFGDEAFVGRGTPTLALLFVAVALRFVTGTLGQGLFASHHQRFFLWASLVTLAVNAVLNLVLAWRFGAVGAAAALVCTELFGLAITTWWMRRKIGYRSPIAFVLRTLVPTFASVAVLPLLSGQHVITTVAAAAAVYVATSMAVGPVRWSTVAAMRGKAGVS